MMRYHVELTYKEPELFRCLRMEHKDRERSSIVIKKQKVVIGSRDAVALRATLDGLMKLLITYEKMKYGVPHGKENR